MIAHSFGENGEVGVEVFGVPSRPDAPGDVLSFDELVVMLDREGSEKVTLFFRAVLCDALAGDLRTVGEMVRPLLGGCDRLAVVLGPGPPPLADVSGKLVFTSRRGSLERVFLRLFIDSANYFPVRRRIVPTQIPAYEPGNKVFGLWEAALAKVLGRTQSMYTH